MNDGGFSIPPIEIVIGRVVMLALRKQFSNCNMLEVTKFNVQVAMLNVAELSTNDPDTGVTVGGKVI